MLTATLYVPGQPPQPVPIDGLALGQVTEHAAQLLSCSLAMVDVLGSGTGYTAYSIFDYQAGRPNLAGMQAVGKVVGAVLVPDDEDIMLYGPILIVEGQQI